jgi:predicted RNase H-like nuclease (RuvC/YqgF family)
MAINLTITVPEELHKRLKDVKKNFNVSQVCQKAIESEVKRQELLQTGLEDMKDVIERLRLEKAESAKKSYDLGYKYGMEDVKEISYGAMFILSRWSSPDSAISECEEAGLEPGNLGYIEGFGARMYINDIRKEDVSGIDFVDDDEFLLGYFRAIIDFYLKIKDQL